MQHFLSRTLLGTHHSKGKERIVFLTSEEEKLIYSIFFLVLYWARIMLGVKSVQFSLHQGRKSLVTAFSLSYSIRHASCFRRKERTVFLTSGEEKFSYSIFSLELYSARIMLGVKSVQFSLHQGWKS